MKRYRIDAVTYQLTRLGAAVEVGRIPGGRTWPWRRAAKRQAADYDRFWQLAGSEPDGRVTRYEVVEVERT